MKPEQTAFRRRLIVGVIGGDDNMARGEELGGEIARRGWILLTGGQILERSIVEAKGAVKDASMVGAEAAEGDRARLVGIIPSHATRWRRPSGRRLFLETGLSHNVRNVITARAPDVLVAFGGSHGTLAEIAFAKAAGREVIFYDGIERLRQSLEKYFSRGSGRHDREIYFEEPLRSYPEAIGACGTVAALIRELGRALAEAIETNYSAITLANRIGTTAFPNSTGFPGLPGDSASKAGFEAIIEEISR